LYYDAKVPVEGLRVGYFPEWMEQATDVDRHALRTLKELGLKPVEVSLPKWPYNSLNVILFAEAAASFEKITLDGAVDEMRMQTPDAWPNTFRQSRFLSAVDYVQTDRMRRMMAGEMVKLFEQVDLLQVPSLQDTTLTLTNFTGHPCLTLRAGFVEVSQARSDWAPNPSMPLPTFNPPRRVPQGVTLIGKLFDEGTIARVGVALEHRLNVWQERPKGF
jgi:Asp-tRNA(Asn)/Glu-tRNA(Gln) amidotransferase A subunit family amidase